MRTRLKVCILLSTSCPNEVLTPPVPPAPPVRPSSIGPVRSNGTSSGSLVSRTQCKNCHLFHQQGRACPNLKTEIQLRLALDEVKSLSGGDPVRIQQNREILQNLLKAKRQGSAGEVAAPPAQPSPQPQLLPFPVAPQPTQPPQQPPQQEQARLVAPPESEEDSSGSDDSASEEESESESEEEEVSGPNVGPEQQGGG